MKQTTTQIIDEAIESDILDDFLSPDANVVLSDLLQLATDYSCHGCSY